MIELTITQFAVGIQQQASPPSQVIQITQGIPGVGLPSGGDTGEVLRKLSGVDYAFEWVQLFVSDLGDVDTTGAATDDLLTYDGTEWVPTSTPSVDRVSFDTLNPATLDAAGDLAWDDLDQALAYKTNGITVDIGQENLVYVRNPPGGSTLPKGAAVAVDGASSNRLRVKLCNSVEGGDGCRTLGVTMGAIPSPGFGFVSTFGLLRGFNTGTIIGGGVTEGSELFISSTPGVLSTQPQASPGRRVTVGYVVTTGTQGSIFVTVRRGLSVNELDNVHAPSPTDGQVLRYVTAAGRYELDTLTPSDVGADSAGSAAAVQGNLDSHTGATTSVHGIADTSALIVEGDARLTNSRFPTLHANTHATGGTDAIAPSDIGAYPASNPSGFVDAAGAAAAAPVQSVDGLTGAVDLSGEYEALGAVDARVPDPTGEADGRILVVDSGALVYDDAGGGVTSRERVLFDISPLRTHVWDDFQRADGAAGNADSGQAWVETTGTGEIDISNGRLRQIRNLGFAPLLILDYSASLGSGEVTNVEMGSECWSVTRGQPPGCVLAYYDNDNYLATGFTNNYQSIRLYKVVGGTLTQLATAVFRNMGATPQDGKHSVHIRSSLYELSNGTLSISVQALTGRTENTTPIKAQITDAGELTMFLRSRSAGLVGGGQSSRWNSFYLRAFP
jgi:hypothetical protein